ncbi:MAG: radical SAM protein [ANME-2 cluster archaeon]|nr:radical SAM protein [ANME-2 cluster archaeon]
MRISYLALSEARCTVQVSGCNFRCRGCFSNERHQGGVEVSPARIAEHIPTGREVMLAGGEPTMNRQELLSLLHELEGRKVIISTNGYCLDRELLENLADVTVHIDLKALDPDLHRWYTGKDNSRVLEAVRMLHDQGFDFEVNTVYIPEVIDAGEIERIAAFLSDIGDIRYKVIRYVPVCGFSRRPGKEEIFAAVSAAGKHLDTVSSSIKNRSHPEHRHVLRLDR